MRKKKQIKRNPYTEAKLQALKDISRESVNYVNMYSSRKNRETLNYKLEIIHI